MTRRRAASISLVAIAGLFVLVTRVPAALAFPHRAQVGAATVLSDRPIDPAIGARLARADALVTAAGLTGTDRAHQVVLTDGGWRWRLLSLRSSGAFGLRRPFSSVLVFNRSDVRADRITNDRKVGGSRSLSGTIAHEMAHWLTADRIGELAAVRQPSWKWEGFADHVARESTLTQAEAESLRITDPSSPPLHYFDARRRVERLLALNGSIDALFD